MRIVQKYSLKIIINFISCFKSNFKFLIAKENKSLLILYFLIIIFFSLVLLNIKPFSKFNDIFYISNDLRFIISMHHIFYKAKKLFHLLLL